MGIKKRIRDPGLLSPSLDTRSYCHPAAFVPSYLLGTNLLEPLRPLQQSHMVSLSDRLLALATNRPVPSTELFVRLKMARLRIRKGEPGMLGNE